MPHTPTLSPTGPRLLPAPRREPPFDPQTGTWPAAATAAPEAQGTLALTFVLGSGVPAVPRLRLASAGGLASAPAGPDDGTDHDGEAAPEDDFGPRRSSTEELPDPRMWAARLAQAAVEVMTGSRPPAQLRRWTSDEVYGQLRRAVSRRRVAAPTRTPVVRTRRAVVRAVRVCEPADGVAEVAAVVDDGRRAHALVLRLEGADGRWRCTQLARV